MTHFDPVMLLVGALGFFLHVFFKFRKDPEENILRWGRTKENLTYIIAGLGLCAAGLIFAPHIMAFLSMSDYHIYSFGMCYGGGHSVAQFMEQKAATPARPKEITEPLDKPGT